MINNKFITLTTVTLKLTYGKYTMKYVVIKYFCLNNSNERHCHGVKGYYLFSRMTRWII
jgi:hypothetical protein